MFLLGRIGSVSATLVLAFLLATAMWIGLSLYLPDIMELILNGADHVEDWMTHTVIPSRYNNFVRLFIGDEQLTFLFFTIVSRILIAIIATLFVRAVKPKSMIDKAFG